mgnify:CR=1 FL=1
MLESEDPYGDSWSPEGLSPALHLQEIQILPEKNYEAVKEAVYFTGGVQSSLYTSMADGEESSDYYNKEEGAYCYTGDRRPNHDVVIIGWDDDYPKENFRFSRKETAPLSVQTAGAELRRAGIFLRILL